MFQSHANPYITNCVLSDKMFLKTALLLITLHQSNGKWVIPTHLLLLFYFYISDVAMHRRGISGPIQPSVHPWCNLNSEWFLLSSASYGRKKPTSVDRVGSAQVVYNFGISSVSVLSRGSCLSARPP